MKTRSSMVHALTPLGPEWRVTRLRARGRGTASATSAVTFSSSIASTMQTGQAIPSTLPRPARTAKCSIEGRRTAEPTPATSG